MAIAFVQDADIWIIQLTDDDALVFGAEVEAALPEVEQGIAAQIAYFRQRQCERKKADIYQKLMCLTPEDQEKVLDDLEKGSPIT
jgi:hypothetical protein